MVIDFSDFIVVTESTLDEIKLRPTEAAKIASARQHVKAMVWVITKCLHLKLGPMTLVDSLKGGTS